MKFQRNLEFQCYVLKIRFSFMNKFKHILIIIILLHVVTTNAQKVSNIAFRQEQSTIIVSYDLESKTPCKVSLYVSTNGGTTWQGPLTKVTGDVGSKVVSGNHNITWNVLEEFEELKGNSIKFQVKAINTVIINLPTVKIGTQDWTTKNLNVSRYRNGDLIPEVRNQKEWDKLTTGAWCYYNNDPKNGAIYGKLYNWYAVNDPRGLAPEGFHIPSEYEWKTLIEFSDGGYIVFLKEKGRKHWKFKPFILPKKIVDVIIVLNDYNKDEGIDEYNFSALPGGHRFDNFSFIGICGGWWSSSSFYSEKYKIKNAITMEIDDNFEDNHYDNSNLDYPAWNTENKAGHVIWRSRPEKVGMSVRCIKD